MNYMSCLETEEKKEIAIIQNKSSNKASTKYQETDIYSVSLRISKIQRLNGPNILATWPEELEEMTVSLDKKPRKHGNPKEKNLIQQSDLNNSADMVMKEIREELRKKKKT